ncbi:MAG: M48 family metalloprotease, partial [Desertimonas sp.]
MEASAIAAVAPALIIAPFCALALLVVWLVVRLAWDIPYWWFVGAYVAAGVLLFWRPLQAAVLTPLLGARQPSADELAILDPVWVAVAQANHLPADRYVLRVLPSEELNAFACGGHLVVVTSFALDELPPRELTGVLAHELSHHLGLHTVALTLEHWLSIPVVVLARVGFWLHNVATAATGAFARDSAGWTTVGQLVAGLLRMVSFPFYAGLLGADTLSNVV